MSILEELYYGNIDPNSQPYNTRSCFGKALASITEREEQLNNMLTGRAQELFAEFCTAWETANDATSIAKFMEGFKLGAQITAEALQGDWRSNL